MEVEVRAPSSKEVKTVSEIAAATFTLACPSSSEKDELEKYISNNLSPSHFQDKLNSNSIFLICAFVNSEMAGFVTVVPSSECILKSGIVEASEIQQLYVLSQFHGTNVAKKLMEAALSHLRSLGSTSVWLGVYSNNIRAKKFYSKYGFSIVGETHFKMGNEIHLDHIMAATIA